MKIKFTQRIAVLAWVIFIVATYTYLLPVSPFLASFYKKSTDLFLRYRYTHNQLPKLIDKIVIVSIDDETLEKIHADLPISTKFYAALLDKISVREMQPLVVGLWDVAFIDIDKQNEEEALLSGAFERSSKVVITSYFTKNGSLIGPPKALLDSASDVGFINYPLDDDLVVRRAYPFMVSKENSRLYFPFALKIFSKIDGMDLDRVKFDVKNNFFHIHSKDFKKKTSIPLDSFDTTSLNYFAKFNDFKVIPFWRVVESWEPPDTFKDKIVLVGTTAEVYNDIRLTPLGLMPTLGINANFLLSLLLNEFLKTLPAAVNFLIFLFSSLLIGIITFRYGNFKGLILTGAVIVIGFYASSVLISENIIFDFFGLLFVSIFSFITVTMYKYLSVVIENTTLRHLAITDGLTGLYVFRYFEAKLNSEIRKAVTTYSDLALVIFDIDHFKEFNDNYGHDLGNEILKIFSTIMSEHSRAADTVSRFGGEEFAVILPQTSLEQAYKYAESIRKKAEEFTLVWQDKALKFTVSAGVSSLECIERISYANFVKSADRALYQAKDSGRNKIISAQTKNSRAIGSVG